MLDGIQDVKAIDKYYSKYDEKFDERKMIEERFCETMDYIANIYDGNFSNTSYNSTPLFYSLLQPYIISIMALKRLRFLAAL